MAAEITKTVELLKVKNIVRPGSLMGRTPKDFVVFGVPDCRTVLYLLLAFLRPELMPLLIVMALFFSPILHPAVSDYFYYLRRITMLAWRVRMPAFFVITIAAIAFFALS